MLLLRIPLGVQESRLPPHLQSDADGLAVGLAYPGLFQLADVRVPIDQRCQPGGNLLIARAVSATCIWFGLARNTATTFDIF